MDLTLILTEDCNLRCTYCYQKQFRPTAMPAETGIAAVRAALERETESLSLTFFGGEPLLQADTLFQVLRAARELEREFRVPVTAKVPTNGLLLDDAFLDHAAATGLFVSLSFDGIRPAQDAGRISLDGSGSFAQAERALRRLLAWGKPFGVYSVITPDNVRYLTQSRRYLWDAGVRVLVSAIDYTATWHEDAIAALVEQYLLLGEFYQDVLGQRSYSHLEPFDSRISLHTRAGEFKSCCPGIRHLTVGPDGTLYGCVEYFYRRMLPLGTVAGWLDPEAARVLARTRTGQAAECLDCGVRDRCTNRCDCVNLRTTGQPNRPPLSLCLTEQATIRAVDTVAARLFRKRLPGFLLRHYSDSYSLLSTIEKLLEDMEIPDERAATSPR
jgi:uncharacterized protein